MKYRYVDTCVAKVNGKTREDLINALVKLCEIDGDFNGRSGLEFLHSDVWEANGLIDFDYYEAEVKEQEELMYERAEREYKISTSYSSYDDWKTSPPPTFEQLVNPSDFEVYVKYKSNMEYVLDLIKDKSTDKEFITSFAEGWVKYGDWDDYRLAVIYDENDKTEVIAITMLA